MTASNAPRRSRRWMAAAALAGSLVLAVPGVASATPTGPSAGAAAKSATVTTVQQRCTNAITARLGQIDQLKSQMTSAANLDPGHLSALSAELTSERSGLVSLQGQITAATTLEQLRTLCPEIVANFRVYVLETPKVHLIIGADRETAISTKLGNVATKLSGLVTKAQNHHLDVGQAPTLLADLQAKVAAASALAGPVPASIIGLTPAQYNGGSAKPALESARNSVVTARGDLITARNDAQQIVTILRGLVGSTTTTS
jgi:hypothetical protein